MANLTTNYDPADKPGELVGYAVKANNKIFGGSLVAIDDTSGYLTKASDTAGLTFAGVAYEGGDNTGGADGAVGIRVKKTGSYIYALNGAQSQAVIGKKCFASDDNTVALSATTTNDLYVGDIVGLVSGGKVRVRIDRAVG